MAWSVNFHSNLLMLHLQGMQEGGGTNLTGSRVKPNDWQTLCGVFWPPP